MFRSLSPTKPTEVPFEARSLKVKLAVVSVGACGTCVMYTGKVHELVMVWSAPTLAFCTVTL